MPERDVYLPGVPCWVDTSQPDPDAAAAFYRDFFGWEFEDAMPPDAPGRYLIGRIHGGASQRWVPNPRARRRSDVEHLRRGRQRRRGHPRPVTPAATCDGAVRRDGRRTHGGARRSRGCRLRGLGGRGNIGAEVVNEPGSLNFNGLNTRDVGGPKEFYGAVFGWKTIDVGGGAEMWTMPGYGDHLEERTPGFGAMMAEMGAPAGFEDVVAAIVPLPDDQPDTPAHWSVTFAVEDADAAAAKAQHSARRWWSRRSTRPGCASTVHRRSAGRRLRREPVRRREQRSRRLTARSDGARRRRDRLPGSRPPRLPRPVRGAARRAGRRPAAVRDRSPDSWCCATPT